jgi:hypothetical protein
MPHPTDNKLSSYVEARDMNSYRRLRNRLVLGTTPAFPDPKEPDPCLLRST